MNKMKQTKAIIKLRKFTTDDHPFGNKEGREVYAKLANYIDTHPAMNIIGVSLEDIIATDASFPRESVISLAKSLRGEKGFYLTDFLTKDIIDNWDYAAKAKEQPLIVQVKDGYEVIGLDITTGVRELMDFIMKQGTVTTSMVADKFDLSAQNASGKLKKLHIQGLVLGTKEIAESGGVEYVYTAIK